MGEEACTSQNPTCGTPLQNGIKILAIIDIVVGLGRFITLLCTMLIIERVIDPSLCDFTSIRGLLEYPQELRDSVAVVILVLLVFVIVEMVLAVVLFFGAKNGNMRMCKIFLIGAGILGILSLVGFIGYIFKAHLIVYILWLPYRIYILICVWMFVKK